MSDCHDDDTERAIQPGGPTRAPDPPRAAVPAAATPLTTGTKTGPPCPVAAVAENDIELAAESELARARKQASSRAVKEAIRRSKEAKRARLERWAPKPGEPWGPAWGIESDEMLGFQRMLEGALLLRQKPKSRPKPLPLEQFLAVNAATRLEQCLRYAEERSRLQGIESGERAAWYERTVRWMRERNSLLERLGLLGRPAEQEERRHSAKPKEEPKSVKPLSVPDMLYGEGA